MKKAVILIATVIVLAAATFGVRYFPLHHTAADANPTPAPEATPVEPSAPPIAAAAIEAPKIELSGKPTAPICTGDKTADFDCYDAYYSSLVKSKGVKAAFADLRTRYPINGYVSSQCHPLTHVIGRTAALTAKNVSDAYTQGDSFCWSGYYHGVLEGIIGKIGSKNLPAQIDTICADIPGKKSYSFDYYNCVHGLGHGVMAISDDALFDSLTMCDNLTGNWEQLSCASGAFMENVIVDNKNHFTKYLNPSDPTYPCYASPDKYKNTCYLMQTSYMLKVSKNDFAKVFDECSQVEEAYRNTCYQSLGRDVSGQSISNVATTKQNCSLGKDLTQKSNCIIGASKDFISYYHSDVQAKELCASLASDLQPVCNTTVESYYKSF